jgi:small subunit ribosomal protein S10
MKQKIRLKLKSFNYKILEKAIKNIIFTISKIGSNFVGPIPIPNRILKFTVNKSPHVYKKSREQFEIRHHFRLIIIDSLPEVIDVLMKLNIAVGIDIHVQINR